MFLFTKTPSNHSISIDDSSSHGSAASSTGKPSVCTEWMTWGSSLSSLSSSKQYQSPYDFIQDQVNQNDIVIFSAWSDNYSRMTEHLFCQNYRRLQLELCTVKIVDMQELFDEQQNDDVAKALVRYTGQPSFPQVFVGGRFVGGYFQTRRALATGDLSRYLQPQTGEIYY
jgi:glutaredoxin-related protein